MPRKQQRVKVVNGVEMVRHRGRLCPVFPLALHDPPPRAYPTADPHWTRFVEFVESGGVVRKDLFQMRDQDWEITWAIFRAGAGA